MALLRLSPAAEIAVSLFRANQMATSLFRDVGETSTSY
jgi:hypothetical protein